MHVEKRHATHPEQIYSMDTDDVRRHYLVDDLFRDDDAAVVYSHQDRVVLGGIKPVTSSVTLTGFPEVRSDDFFARREAGIVNIGGKGSVTVGGDTFEMVHGACLYIGRGSENPVFSSASSEEPAMFYVFSAPAHKEFPTVLTEPGKGNIRELGDQKTSNRRSINQYIHEDGVQSCQVVMGVTTLHEGNMWNTMPAHTHDRRTECYIYFDLPEDARIVHFLGEPQQTRHMVVKNADAVISPSWSIHSGVGTEAYSFVWAMAGENKAFDDMDTFPVVEMR